MPNALRTARSILASALLCAPFALGSCNSPNYVAYEFRPRPLTIDVQGPGDAGFVARAVVSILGIVEDDERDPKGHLVQVRMHLENLSREPISLDEPRWLLLSADVKEFAAPRIPTPPPELPRGGQTTVDLFFPVPVGRELASFDLSSLNLSFGVNYLDATVVVTATFERWLIEPYGPYYYDPYYSNGTTTQLQTTVGIGFGF